jgi:hypothetical protein
MNKSMLPRLQNQRVRLRPVPRFPQEESRGLPGRDPVFHVIEASPNGLTLQALASQSPLQVPPDHLREYLSDGERDGFHAGFLYLKVQWFFIPGKTWFEPIFGDSRTIQTTGLHHG